MRVTIEYADAKIQTVHYYITKSAIEVVTDLGNFLTTSQWFNDSSDTFGRAPSVITYDYEVGKIVSQDDRVWISGLSDEAGTDTYLAAFMKQSAQPNAEEAARLETFMESVLWKLFRQKTLVSGRVYSSTSRLRSRITLFARVSIGRAGRRLTKRHHISLIDHTIMSTFLLRIGPFAELGGRTRIPFPAKLQWYPTHAHNTVMKCMELDANGNPIVGYADPWLMDEIVL